MICAKASANTCCKPQGRWRGRDIAHSLTKFPNRIIFMLLIKFDVAKLLQNFYGVV